MSTTSAATSQPSSRQAAGAAVGLPAGLTAVAFTVVLPDAVPYVYVGAQLAGVGWIYACRSALVNGVRDRCVRRAGLDARRFIVPHSGPGRRPWSP
jgi:hypothetical protein